MTYIWHVYETIGAWRACYKRPPTVGQLIYATGLNSGIVRWALIQLWRKRLVKWNGGRREE